MLAALTNELPDSANETVRAVPGDSETEDHKGYLKKK